MGSLAGTHLIDVNLDLKTDRELYQTAQKLFALILSFGQAMVYVLTGLYGQPADLGAGVCVLLVVQLCLSGLIVILLDELLQKGYGLGRYIASYLVCDVPSINGISVAFLYSSLQIYANP